MPRRNLAATAVLILHVRQIAREHVFAHVATVAIVVGFAESERIAIISGLAGIVVDGKFSNVSAAVPVAVYSPVISPTVGLTFGSSMPIVTPITATTTSKIRIRSSGPSALTTTFFEPLAGPLDITHVAFNIPIIIRITIILSRHNY
mgnify:CR=1 FL=1